MATDAKGNELFAGDEVVVRCKVRDVNTDHVLTTTVEAPSREHWFESKVVERTEQGPHSKGRNGTTFDSVAGPKTADEILMDAGIAKAKELRAKSLTTAAH